MARVNEKQERTEPHWECMRQGMPGGSTAPAAWSLLGEENGGQVRLRITPVFGWPMARAGETRALRPLVGYIVTLFPMTGRPTQWSRCYDSFAHAADHCNRYADDHGWGPWPR